MEFKTESITKRSKELVFEKSIISENLCLGRLTRKEQRNRLPTADNRQDFTTDIAESKT
jgi:hypothetical protein